MSDDQAARHAALIRSDIERHGIHILHVAESGGFPPVSYSVGMNRSMNVPDIAIVGLHRDACEMAIRRYRDGLLAKRTFRIGERIDDLFASSEGELRPIHPSHFHHWFDFAVAVYGGSAFRMVQLVYPATDGSWPWEPQAAEWFRRRQPLLEKPALADG